MVTRTGFELRFLLQGTTYNVFRTLRIKYYAEQLRPALNAYITKTPITDSPSKLGHLGSNPVGVKQKILRNVLADGGSAQDMAFGK